MRFYRITLVMMASLLLIAGCGGEEVTPTPALPVETRVPTRRPVVIPTTPPGWTPYSRSTFQIALPDTWEEVKLGKEQLEASIAAAQESNPPLADQLRSLLESGQAQNLLLYGVQPSGGVLPPNVSVSHIALEEGDTLESVVQTYASALPNIIRGASIVEVQSNLLVNGIRAASFVYDVSLVDNSGNLRTLRGVQFLYLLDSGDAYLVTVTGDAAGADAFMPLARQIATSFVAVTP